MDARYHEDIVEDKEFCGIQKVLDSYTNGGNRILEDIRKIKDIYGCETIISDGELYPLQKWYNQLIDKTVSEISVADVLRMIRQKQFIKLAMSKAIKFLQDDVFTGEAYDGEALEKISELESSLLIMYKDDLKNIIQNALEKSEIHEWSYDGEENEFKEILNVITRKLIQ